MKKTKKLLPILLTIAMGLTATFAFAGCDETYTTTETDSLISELQATIDSNKSELEGKITALTEAYKAKDAELLQAIEANQQAIADMQAEYAEKLAALEKADSDNKKAIDDLTADYTAKVEELVASDTANANALAALRTEYESKVEALEKADGDNKQAIADLKTEYLAKVEELVASDTANANALAELKAAYETKVEALEKADSENKQEIANLTSEYNAKVADIESEIAKANAKIESNKTELNGAITALTTAYEAKMAQIDALLATIQSTDTTQDEKIAALEAATRITDIRFADNGDLVITFGDGSTQTVKAPEQHVHTAGEWTAFTDSDTSCEERLFFRVCEDCHSVEWKQGTYDDHDFTIVTTAPTCTAQGYDTKTCKICGKVEIVNYTPTVPHPWETEYSADNSYHWYGCATCDDVKDKEEHTDDGSGNCSVCGYLIGPTAGIIYDVVDGKARVITYEGTATRVRIAETYNGAPVTEIAGEAFENCDRITSIAIPDSVTSIGYSAFSDCDSLTSVEIPDSVTSIGSHAFQNCSGLTSVAIPDSVTLIGYSAFSHCDSLTSVVIGDSVTSIGDFAFYYCKRLMGVVIPDSVTSIGDSAFSGCNKLISEYNYVKYLKANDNPYFAVLEVTNKNFSTYTIHPDTKIIANKAFSSCDSLTSVVIGGSVTSICDRAFRNCSSLTSIKYRGTQEEWNAISKGSSWNYNTGDYTITYNYQD